MKLRVYNRNGEVSVVKVKDGHEYRMFHVAEGEAAEIDIEVAGLSVNGYKMPIEDLSKR